MANDIFLGTGMKFPPQIDPATGRFMTVSGNQVVKEALYLILMTQVTERFARPDFGSNIMSYTFMDTGSTALTMLRTDLTRTILMQEPRISDLEVNTEYRDSQGAIIISINYVVTATNTRDNLVFPFYLDRADESEADASDNVEADYFDGDDRQASFIMEDEEF